MMLLLNEDERCFYITKNKKIIFTKLETEVFSCLLSKNPLKAYDLAKLVYDENVLYPYDDYTIHNNESSIKQIISRMNKKYSKYFKIINKNGIGYSLKFYFKVPKTKGIENKIKIFQEENKLINLNNKMKEITKEIRNTKIKIKSIEKKLKI
ncbi:MAG: hypothetical protein ACI31S_01545 [Bacilli bacterium]